MKFRWTTDRISGHHRVMLAVAALGISIAATSPADAGRVSGLAMADNNVVLRFDGSVSSASAVLLQSPLRIALDINGAQAAGARFAVRGDSALVDNVRQGQVSSGTARVVLDLARPATLSSARFSPDGRALSLTLKGATTAQFSAATLKGRSPIAIASSSDAGAASPAGFARTPSRTHSITVKIPTVAKGVSLPKIYGPNDASRPLVVIDAGHGGHDPGAINPRNGLREKDVTLAIAKAIRNELVATGRVRVALTRDDDEYLMLPERYGIARRMRADLFISIHADSAETSQARGATIYTLSETASDREAARLAARENKADIINGVNLSGQSGDVPSILIDLTQRETMNLSSNFAQLLQREASPYVSFTKAYHRFASLMVLKAPDMPSVLFETGYISNDLDAAKLAASNGQRQIAKGVAQAINVHFARRLAMR